MRSRPSHSHRSNRPSRDRQQQGGHQSVWLYGRHAVLAALANPERRIERILATKEAAERHAAELGNKVELFSRDDLGHRLPAGAVHQGLAALVAPLEEPQLEDVLARCGEQRPGPCPRPGHRPAQCRRHPAQRGGVRRGRPDRHRAPRAGRHRRAGQGRIGRAGDRAAGARREPGARARATEGSGLLAVRPRRARRRRRSTISISAAAPASCWAPRAKACAG